MTNYFANQTCPTTSCQCSNVITCTPKTLDQGEFRALVLDALLRKLNLNPLTIAPADMETAINNAECSLQAVDSWPEISDAQWNQLLLYLVNQVGATL